MEKIGCVPVGKEGILVMDIGSALKVGKGKREPEPELSVLVERAREIHSESCVIDGRQGTLLDVLYGTRDISRDTEPGHVSLPQLKQAGVTCSVLSAFLTKRLRPLGGVKAGLQYADAFWSLAELPDVQLCMSARDVEQVWRQGSSGFMLGFEGGEFLDSSIASLRMFARLGLRFLTLTWSERNALADGTAESSTRGGLTHFGRSVVKECGRIGVAVDVSHLSEAGFWDVVDVSEAPFVASHSNCYALYGHPRNLTDDQLEAVAESGGLVGISLNPEYLSIPGERPGLSLVCDQIEHALEVAGEECVGIGSDFDAFSDRGPLDGVERLPDITCELLRRGVSGEVIGMVLGGNWLRVLRAVCG